MMTAFTTWKISIKPINTQYRRNVNRDFLYIIYLFEIMTAPDSEAELEIQWNVY